MDTLKNKLAHTTKEFAEILQIRTKVREPVSIFPNGIAADGPVRFSEHQGAEGSRGQVRQDPEIAPKAWWG